MVWLIAACAVAVLVVASFAAVGRFGELPDAVVDTYAPTLPGGPLSPEQVRAARFGHEVRGYSPQAVRRFLDALVADGSATGQDVRQVRFPTALVGLSMAQVDAALERIELPERPRDVGWDEANPAVPPDAAHTFER